MSHKEQQDFIKKVKTLFPDKFKNKMVIDFGSLDINGSNRQWFENCNYTGVDINEGKNVDYVSRCHDFIDDNIYDVVISTEMLEHDMYWKKSLSNMLSLLSSGGLLIITCATTGRPEHGTKRSEPFTSPFTSQIDTWCDYYKNLTIEDVASVINPKQNFSEYFENQTTITKGSIELKLGDKILVEDKDYIVDYKRANSGEKNYIKVKNYVNSGDKKTQPVITSLPHCDYQFWGLKK